MLKKRFTNLSFFESLSNYSALYKSEIAHKKPPETNISGGHIRNNYQAGQGFTISFDVFNFVMYL